MEKKLWFGIFFAFTIAAIFCSFAFAETVDIVMDTWEIVPALNPEIDNLKVHSEAMLFGVTEEEAECIPWDVRVYCADETIKAKVDSEGYFLAELPMLFEGETIEIKAYDLAGNLQEFTLTVGEKPEPIKAHVKGKLFPQYDLDKIDWLQEKQVSREELEAGLVLPILAGNLFPVGEMQVRLVNGEVEIGYSMLFPELEVRDEYFAIHTDKVDRVDVLSRRAQGLTPGTPVRLEEEEAGAYWIYAAQQVVLTPEQMEDDLEAYLVHDK